jgi:ubiquinone/menaquinone biosynthesis C-methylase UbiE
MDLANPKRTVEHGYDRVAERHAEWASHTRTDERLRYTSVLLQSLSAGAAVLELGCGTAEPTTRALAARFHLTGVDISARSIEIARRNVPTATFLHADMTTLTFPLASFDGVAAFYSLIHVPRDEQPTLLGNITGWLRPGGLFVATLGIGNVAAGYEEDWLGAPMYWSSFDAATDRHMIAEVGLGVVMATEETADEDGVPVAFLWVVARKPER